MILSEPYRFDGNLILASSNHNTIQKGYKTAGTDINMHYTNNTQNESKQSENNDKWKSPEIINAKNRHAYMTNTNFYSERNSYVPAPLVKKYHKNDTLEDIPLEGNRDISPYRIENFVDMLHQFGVSDSTIKRKLVNSPIRHNKYPYDEVQDSFSQTSIIRNVSNSFTKNA